MVQKGIRPKKAPIMNYQPYGKEWKAYMMRLPWNHVAEVCKLKRIKGEIKSAYLDRFVSLLKLKSEGIEAFVIKELTARVEEAMNNHLSTLINGKADSNPIGLLNEKNLNNNNYD